MKTRPLFIGIIVILALLCSPVLAISQSDLISQFRPQGTGTGTLSVTSNPVGADVYLDGVYKGTTSGEPQYPLSLIWDYQPVTITGVPTGLHNLRVTLSGYEDYSSWVIIPDDKTVTVHVSLKLQSGSTAIPTTVPTRIPTIVPPRTPTPVPTTIPAGQPLFDKWGVTIRTPSPTPVPTIGPTEQLPLFVTTGAVSVSSIPTGARVHLDGVDRGIFDMGCDPGRKDGNRFCYAGTVSFVRRRNRDKKAEHLPVQRPGPHRPGTACTGVCHHGL